MTQNVYKLIHGSAAEAFHLSRIKIRLYAGGFANGKTTALVADALRVARDYPGATMMLGRENFPKLNSTLRREFFKWMPPNWQKSFNQRDNNLVLKNGTIIDFRYIDQRQNSDGESTSNLLSANYDYIGVDQMEDTGITEHDFEQLLGRLRGSTRYAGDDVTMPQTGPRLMALTCNPTLGWVYKRLVKPLHDLRAGRYNPDLICEVDSDGNVILTDGKPTPLIEVFEASTYENAQNLEADYIKTLEATYRGKMRDRYLLGKWVAFEGVVYDEFDEDMHVIASSQMENHIKYLRLQGYRLTLLEGYDFGVVQPSCYLLALVDGDGNVYIMDGFYQGGTSDTGESIGIDWQVNKILELREKHAGTELLTRNSEPEIYADPAIFRRTNAGATGMGKSTATLFYERGVHMRRGNNNILNGIVKVKQYLHVQRVALNPFTHAYGSPKLFVSDKLTWFRDEIISWRWRRAKDDTSLDEPIDRDNHAMDALKYMLTAEAAPARMVASRAKLPQAVNKWHETDVDDTTQYDRKHRYAMS